MNEAKFLDRIDHGEVLDVEFKSAKGGFPKDALCNRFTNSLQS